jgi:hypothetical protein
LPKLSFVTKPRSDVGDHADSGIVEAILAVKVEPVGEFELKGVRRPLATYDVLDADPVN